MTKKELLSIKERADKDILKLGHDLTFDHFAIKTPSHESYKELCSLFGGEFREVFQSGRNIATIISDFGTLEIMEPKKDEAIKEAYINHIGYVASNFKEIEISICPISKFEIGNSKGIFIKPSDTLIQIRNKPLKDFLE